MFDSSEGFCASELSELLQNWESIWFSVNYATQF